VKKISASRPSTVDRRPSTEGRRAAPGAATGSFKSTAGLNEAAHPASAAHSPISTGTLVRYYDEGWHAGRVVRCGDREIFIRHPLGAIVKADIANVQQIEGAA